MEVIFTHPMHEHLTLRGTVIQMVTNHSHFKDHFVVQERADYGTGVCYNVIPNDDPKFQFVPSAEYELGNECFLALLEQTLTYPLKQY